MTDWVTRHYDPLLCGARARLDGDECLAELRAPNLDPNRLELFLMYFSSRGVRMTKPVEGWIHRAGRRCASLGMMELGHSLEAHARHEAGHEQMMIADTRFLVGRYNARHGPKLDPDSLLAQPATAAIAAYVRLHENTI